MKKVYLLKTDEYYKIGIANNVNRRISQLQTGNSRVIKLVDCYESLYASKIEGTLHNKFAYARKEGEWFDLSLKDEVDFLKECHRIESNIKLLVEAENQFI